MIAVKMSSIFAAVTDQASENMDSHEHKSLIQQQFGRSARDYATSDVHATGESLEILLALVSPESDWSMLDVATGAGHTAIVFASLVNEVTASDITQEMLLQTESLAKQRGISNLSTAIADAESLPFEDETFDLVTCRLAFHHFQNQKQALAEYLRVLKPKGILGFTDNYTVEDSIAADFYNQFEKIRDPSHYCVHSLASLRNLFSEIGFEIQESVCLSKEFEFHKWADRQRVSDHDKIRLLEMFNQTPNALTELFKPRKDEKSAYFSLAEVVIVATKKC